MLYNIIVGRTYNSKHLRGSFMSEEKIIDRIKKLLSLAGNNPNSAEAGAAALKAQELMAKHGVSVETCEDDIPEKIDIVTVQTDSGAKWKRSLATVIAQNFRCKTFTYGKKTIAFYGKETDAKAAMEVFNFLLHTGHKLAMKARADLKKQTGLGDGAYNSFALGFLHGVKEKLDEQCKALMIVIAPEVETEFAEFIKGAKTSSNSFNQPINPNLFNRGKREGRDAMSSRQLEG